MNKDIKITQTTLKSSNIFNLIGKFNNETIDLSELNIFDTAKTIIMISSYNNVKIFPKKFELTM